MDLGEALFKTTLKLWRRGWFRQNPGEAPHAALLAEHLGRLDVSATLVLGERREIKAADDGIGGSLAQALLLPARIDVFPSVAANIEVYIYRMAWACAGCQLGFEGIASGHDKLFDSLLTCLAVGATRERLHQQFPATRELTPRLQTAALALRPVKTRSLALALEALIALQLGGSAEHVLKSQPKNLRDFVEAAASAKPTNAAALKTTAHRLYAMLNDVGGRGAPPPGVLIWGALLPALGSEQGEADASAPSAEKKSGREVIELDRTVTLRRQKLGAREDRPLFHVFEKIETAQEYSGQSATPDGQGEVGSMQEALGDLGLGAVVRTPDAPDGLVRANFVVADAMGLDVASSPVPSARVFTYPEWDYRRGKYRPNWCTVSEETLGLQAPQSQENDRMAKLMRGHQREIDAIAGHLIRALHKRQMRTRQSDGPDIDVEAMVERHADLMAGHTPPTRLYLASRRALREVAILVLLDASWSTDAWVAGARVLDVAVSSLLVVARAFEGMLEREVAVASFCSHTRNDVRFCFLKDFHDPWLHLRRVAPLVQPDGYTRIGAAMRHAVEILDTTKARKKLLILLSDGKPSDYDRYEGQYGIEDVRRSIGEARQKRIRVFGLAIEKEAKRYLARMLGVGGYKILHKTSMLPQAMSDAFITMVTD